MPINQERFIAVLEESRALRDHIQLIANQTRTQVATALEIANGNASHDVIDAIAMVNILLNATPQPTYYATAVEEEFFRKHAKRNIRRRKEEKQKRGAIRVEQAIIEMAAADAEAMAKRMAVAKAPAESDQMALMRALAVGIDKGGNDDMGL